MTRTSLQTIPVHQPLTIDATYMAKDAGESLLRISQKKHNSKLGQKFEFLLKYSLLIENSEDFVRRF